MFNAYVNPYATLPTGIPPTGSRYATFPPQGSYQSSVTPLTAPAFTNSLPQSIEVTNLFIAATFMVSCQQNGTQSGSVAPYAAIISCDAENPVVNPTAMPIFDMQQMFITYDPGPGYTVETEWPTVPSPVPLHGITNVPIALNIPNVSSTQGADPTRDYFLVYAVIVDNGASVDLPNGFSCVCSYGATCTSVVGLNEPIALQTFITNFDDVSYEWTAIAIPDVPTYYSTIVQQQAQWLLANIGFAAITTRVLIKVMESPLWLFAAT